MNGHKSANKNRGYRNLSSRRPRAIRSALALSAGNARSVRRGTALAGTCAVTSSNEVTCNGVFTDDVTNRTGHQPRRRPDADRRHRRRHDVDPRRASNKASPRPWKRRRHGQIS
jgi:hypothetical protein